MSNATVPLTKQWCKRIFGIFSGQDGTVLSHQKIRGGSLKMNAGMARYLELLRKSTFRARFKLSEKDLAYIREKGMKTIRAHTVDFISTRIAP